MKIFSKESLIQEFFEIEAKGWIRNRRNGNQGGIGNTLEDLLGIEENNLPIPNAAEWELKSQRLNTTSLTTLFHIEPSPRALRFVPEVLVPKYGWAHQFAGIKYGINEKSFRQTIHGLSCSDRGFKVVIDRVQKKVLISFDHNSVAIRHNIWLDGVVQNVGFDELNPQPYWGFDDLEHKVGTKLLNCFYVQAEVLTADDEEYYHYSKVQMLRNFSFQEFLHQLEIGNILVDFDARTGHNHGTKFRLRQNCFDKLYEHNDIIINAPPLPRNINRADQSESNSSHGKIDMPDLFS